MEPIRQFGADAMRYWAASGRPGVDTAVDEGQMKVGRRLAIKILNASKFALGVMGDGTAAVPDVSAVTAPIDRSMLASLRVLVADATTAFDGYDYARALENTERFFWGFCDDYLELVKQRAYGGAGDEAARSAQAALATALHTLLRLFAPHLPFVTEEVWSWWQEANGSVHRAPWPTPSDLDGFADADLDVYPTAAAVLGELRKAKSSAKRSMRTDVTSAVVRAPAAKLRALEPALDDVRDAGRLLAAPELLEAEELDVEAELAPPDDE
jgi:valyl-tRNA synthetase